MALNLSLIEQLREFESALVAEAMGAMGSADPEKYYTGMDIKLLTQTTAPVVGVTLTLTADTSTPGNKAEVAGLYESYGLIRNSALPVVVMVKSTGSRPGHECILGDGMAKMLKSYGSSGLVTDGGARDIKAVNSVGYAVFGSGTVANHVPIKIEVSREPVTLSGVQFATGDLVHADSDGVLKIPEKYHQGIVEACILSRGVETRVHTYWRRSDKSPEEKKDFVTKIYTEHVGRCKALLSESPPSAKE